MSQRIHIVALGARTPVGLNAAASAAAVRAGISRLTLHPFLADQTNESIRGATDRLYDADILGAPRIGLLASSALAQVLTLPLPRGSALTVLVALPERRPGFGQKEEHLVFQLLRESSSGTDLHLDFVQAGRGHAGGLEALAQAVSRLQDGRAELCLIGGADSYFDYNTIDWLQAHRQLQNRETRGGFPPGEAAGFLALAGEALRRRLRLPSLGVVRGVGLAHETRLIKSDQGSLGHGLAQAIAQATAHGPWPEQAADDVYCDINGERYRSEEWSLAMLRVPHAMKHQEYMAPVTSWGDVGAASGPLCCALATQAWARRYARGRQALVWGGSEAGLRAAVTLTAPEEM